MSGAVDVAAQPNRDEGQQWARDELSDPVYQDADLTLFERIGRAIGDFFDDLGQSVSSIDSPILFAVLLVVIVAAAGLIIWWARRGAGVRLEPTAPRTAVFRSELDPQKLRDAAHAAAEAGDWRLAVQELVRAVFADQARVQRITIDRASTAQELATASAEALPASADSFTALAALFDEVSFSGARVAREDWESCRALDDRIAGRARAAGGGA
jgi:hypothetical protein